MKKLLILCLTLLLSFPAVFAMPADMVRISEAGGSFYIKEPNGVIYSYKKDDLASVPDFLYGSTINCVGNSLTITLFNSINLYLEKSQSAFITKDPITGELIIMDKDGKSLNSASKIVFNDNASAAFEAGAIISVLKTDSIIYLKVIRGSGRVKVTQGTKITQAHEGNIFEIPNL